MYCPKCQAEYREGFTVCADCNVELVEALPPEPETDFADYEELLATYNQGDIVTVKSILEKEGIPYFIKGEMFTGMGAFIDPARVMVIKDEVEQARLLLKYLDLAYAGINLRDDETNDDESE